MAVYKYRAKKGLKEIIDGVIEAQSEKEAIEKISSQDILPLSIEPVESAAKTAPIFSGRLQQSRIKSAEVTIFSRQLASLLKSGVPILNALNIISEQSESQNFKAVLRSIYNSIKEGATFSSVLAQYPKAFPPLYVALVNAGENSGSLPQTLLRIADYRLKHEELVSRFRMSMAYPILMAVVGLGTVIFMLAYVMPRLMGIFVNMGQALPLPTRILISISNFLRHRWYWVIIILTSIVIIFKRQSRSKEAKRYISILKLRLPIFGKLILKTELGHFCRTLGLLIENGVSILRGIEVTIPVLENECLREQVRESYQQLKQGGSFGRSIKASKFFPAFMGNLISVGEESGKLDEALAEIANSYERDADAAMKVMSSLLEPLMILVTGLIVGFIVISMLLPIFEINMMAR
jgi:general secretion pathway protein F